MSKLSDSKFLNIYKDEMKAQLMRVHPDWDEKKLDDKILKILEKKLKNPDVILDNNYIGRTEKSTLLGVIDWALERKPIIGGNGTFFKQHKEIPNPDTAMVRGFLTDRADIKKHMFTFEPGTREYKMDDLKQNNKKKLANSFYGCSGAKSSPFYNKWCATATTSTAQSCISTTETLFEAFLMDNYVFIEFNELIEWVNSVLKEKVKLDDWVIRKSKHDVVRRLSDKVFRINDRQRELIDKICSNMTEEELTRLYWKDNLIKFTEMHQNVKDIHDEIFKSIKDYDEVDSIDEIPDNFKDKFIGEKDPVKAWNKFVSIQKFYDPNKAPDTIINKLEELKDIYMKYVYHRFTFSDRIYRLKNFRKKVVTVIDTDSNILSLDTWMNYARSSLMTGTYNREARDNKFVAINTITYVISAVVNDTLLYYGECSNVEESKRSLYEMKNEFYFSRLIMGKTKKRYLSRVELREGNLMKKPKFDVKGFDFKKAHVSKEAKDFFLDIVKTDLLSPDEIDLKVMMQKLNGFRLQIIDSLKNGETTYLQIENAKELDAYDDPGDSMGVRGCLAWNACNPDNLIEFPVKLPLVKLTLDSEKKLEVLKNNADLYTRIDKEIINDKKGIFVKLKKKSKGQQVPVCSGLSVLSIPAGEKIPEWAIPYIDYRTTVNNILSPFNSVTEIFNIPGIEEGPTGKKTRGMSNIIKL